MTYLEVAVTVPIENTLTYSVSSQQEDGEAGLDRQNLIGRRVLVPLGNRKITGYVVGLQPTPLETEYKIKEILEFLGDSPIFHENLVPFFRWVANYYHYPLGLVLKTALPSGLTTKSQKILVLKTDKASLVDFFPDTIPAWIAQIVAQGELSPRETTKIMADKSSKKLVGKLLKSHIISLGVSLSKDTVREKYETCYAFAQDHLLPSVDIDTSPEKIKNYRQTINDQNEIELSLSETRALYALHSLSQEYNGKAVALREIRTCYSGASKALANLLAKGMVVETHERVFRSPFGEQLRYYPRPEQLSREQNDVLDKILPTIQKRIFAPFLLHGITGCGKTEVYLQAAEKTLAEDRDVLILVPEIALATQLESHLLSRFGDQVVLLHSGLSSAERFDQFSLALSGKARVVIGARSAIFAPLKDPGLIVVDEEHDASFKQDDNFRYHGRDLAVLRARHHGSVVILGSATPSITSYAHAQSGKYVLLNMTERVGSRSLPTVTLIDLNKKRAKDNKRIIQPELFNKLSRNLSDCRQSILLLNRRGFSAVVLCRDCGTPVQCSHCHVSLTLHKGKNQLVCHYCGFTMPGKTICLQCQSTNLVPAGFGTERVEEEVRELLPDARITRLDSDTASDRKKFLSTLADMHSGKIDILIGTQMIAKGHHFPNVTLVGVVWADGGMSMPDFRAAEKTFQLLTQVTGRAGRGDEPGEVIIQTMRPNHYAIVYARQHEYGKMFEHEMRLRKHPVFPPFVRLTVLRVKGRVEADVQATALTIARFCRKAVEKEKYRIEVLGPAPSPLDKIKDNYRWQVLIKGVDTDELHALCTAIQSDRKAVIKRDCDLSIDVDPENMM
ncbi:MAG: primosomal protein N' [Proteobacteria bacterium]|nr:primosomal protein N' [Pseudomonadota bacterium]